MGRLIKNHLARLIMLASAAYQILAAILAFFYPMIFWDMWTKGMNGAVKPFPILQILNVIVGLLVLCWEYPLPYLIPNTALHRSIPARLFTYPIPILLAALLSPATDSVIYYIIGMVLYYWGYREGESVCIPWRIPTRFSAPPNNRVGTK